MYVCRGMLSACLRVQQHGSLRSALHALQVIAIALCIPACQSDVSTPFPVGLEPLEPNPIAAQPDGPFDETLRTQTSDQPYIHVYARGFVRVPHDVMWAAIKSPDPNVSTCKTDEQLVTVANAPEYEFSFLVHYIVHDILTVEWDDQWRFGTIDDTFGTVKHQKTQGSDIVTLSEGTIDVNATSDPGVTELSFVEHLDAVSATVADVVQGVQHNYDALVAVAHGNPIPACP